MSQHSSIDPAQTFETFVARHPEWRSPSTFEPLRSSDDHYALQPWPILLSPEACADARRFSVGLVDLLGVLLERCFDNEPGPIAEYFSFDGGEMIAELILSEPNGIDGAICRGDFIETVDGFRCIEINAGSGIGAWPVTRLGHAYDALPGFRGFFEDHGWTVDVRDTSREIFHHLLDGLEAEGRVEGPEVHIVFGLRQPQARLDEAALQRTLQEVAEDRGLGIPCRFGFGLYGDLTFGRDGVSHRGQRIDAFFEQEGDSGTAGRQLFGLSKAGRVQLYTGPATRFISDKRMLALMSEHQRSDRLTTEEQQLVEALIPWTRRLRRGTAEYGDEAVDLPEFLASERSRFVLKKGFSFSGRDVVLGFECGDGAWQEAVGKALDDGDWIVQEAVEGRQRRLFHAHRGEPVDHRVVWGFFAFGGQFRGGVHRATPSDQSAVINVTQEASIVPHFELGHAEDPG